MLGCVVRDGCSYVCEFGGTMGRHVCVVCDDGFAC